MGCIVEQIYEWAYNKYNCTPLEFRKACCEGKLTAHEYYIDKGYFDDDELREMGTPTKAS